MSQAKTTSEQIAVLELQIASLGQSQDNQNRDLRQQIRDVISLVNTQGVELRAAIDQLVKSFSDSRRTNWPLIIAASMLILALLGGGSVIIRQQTDNTVLRSLNDFRSERESVSSALSKDIERLNAMAEVSKTDRAKTVERVEKLEERQLAYEVEERGVNKSLIEVETQFRLSDQNRNIQFAEQQRMNNILMQLSQGVKPVKYPEGPYYMPHTTADGKQE